MKRFHLIFILLLIASIVLPVTQVHAADQNDSTLSIGLGRYDPDILEEGKQYSISGKIRSNYEIRSITVAIYKKDGKTILQKVKVKPLTKSFNIKELRHDLKFSALAKGTYYFRVIAKDASGLEATLVDNIFTVGHPKSMLRIKKSHCNPVAITKGKPFLISGTVFSNYKLLSVKVGLYAKDGETVIKKKTVKPGTNTYDLSLLQNKFKFEELEKGTYYLKITAKDASGLKEELLCNKFTVVSKKKAMDLLVEGTPQYYDTGELDEHGVPIYSDVYGSGSGMCTDCSLTTMLQRKEVLLTGVKSTITFKKLWKAENYYFSSYRDLTVGTPKRTYEIRHAQTSSDPWLYGTNTEGDKYKDLDNFLELLMKHPEGVCIFCRYPDGGTHAILISKYQDGIFYAYDPVGTTQRPVEQTWLASMYGSKYTTDNEKAMRKMLKKLNRVYYIAGVY